MYGCDFHYSFPFKGILNYKQLIFSVIHVGMYTLYDKFIKREIKFTEKELFSVFFFSNWIYMD